MTLPPVKSRRVKRILESKFIGIANYSFQEDNLDWDLNHTAKIKRKIIRRHWWWPFRIKD